MQDATPNSTIKTPSESTFGLRFVFGLMIGCSFFFALFQFWPPLAIAIALLATPAMIRVGNIENQHRIFRRTFGWRERITYFACSIGMMFNSAVLAAATFALTCLTCSLFGYGFGQVFNSSFTSPREVALIGATGGVIWGATAAVLVTGWYWIKNWLPELRMSGQEK